jgi:succinyl-diaminopimelate desuccinylase
MAHDGLARVISPVDTGFDGDIASALASAARSPVESMMVGTDSTGVAVTIVCTIHQAAELPGLVSEGAQLEVGSTGQHIVERVSAAVEAVREEMLEFLAELVRHETINPPGEGYRDCAEFIARTYADLGYEVRLVEAAGHRDHTERWPRVNVLGRRGRDGATLHFNGHFDVVPPGEGWTVLPFGATREAGRIYGRGTADQKAGLAVSLFAIEALRRVGLEPAGVVEQSATVDEESGGFAGVAYLCERGFIRSDRTSYVIITEPLGYDRICLGHRGVYWFELVARGRTAHGSMPSLGVNAAEQMASVIAVLNEQLKPRLQQRLTAMPVEPPLARHPTLNLNSLHGGQLTSGLETPCVPDVCRAVFDRRFIAEESFDSVKNEIAQLVETASRGSPASVELHDVMIVEPVQTSTSARLVRTLQQAIQDVLGRPPALIASPGTYDQKHVVRIGGVQECVAYGPGILELAHQPDEYVEIDHLVESAKVIALAALRLLGTQAAPS